MSEVSTKEKKKKINNLATRGFTYCCGMIELGNFNYIDPPGGKKMTHYHGIGGGWKPQENTEGTTEEEILAQIKWSTGGVMASTGAGQEYVEPILEKIGFKKVFTFVNPGHANTPVNIWCYSKNAK